MELDFSNPMVIGASVVVGLLVLFGVLSFVRTLQKYRAPVMVALIIGLVVGGITGWKLKPPDDCPPVLTTEDPIVPPPEEKSSPANPNTPDTLQTPPT